MSANAEEPPSRQAKHVLETGYEPYYYERAAARGRYSYKIQVPTPVISYLASLYSRY